MSEDPDRTPPLGVRWTSRQFIVTLVGMGLCFWATMESKNVGPLSGVVIVAITGAAGVNWQERKHQDQDERR